MSDFAQTGAPPSSTPTASPAGSDAPAPGSHSPGAPESGSAVGTAASAESAPASQPSVEPVRFSLPGLLADFDERVGAQGAESPSAEGGQPPAAPGTRFRFADQEYESQSQAEQAFRSLQGQFKPLSTRASTAEEAARAWAERAMQLEQQLAAAAGGQQGQPAKAEPTAPSPAPDPVEAVDMEFFGQLVEDHGLTVATTWLIPQIAKAIEGKVEARLTEMVGPLQAHTAEQQTLTRVNTLWSQVAAQRDAGGQPLYPELADEQTAQEVAYTWTKLGLTPEMAMSPTGIHLAVLAYRDFKAAYGSTNPSTTAQSPPGVSAGAQGGTAPNPIQASLAAQSAVASGNGSPPAARPIEGNPELTNELALRRAILASGDRRGILGFTE